MPWINSAIPISVSGTIQTEPERVGLGEIERVRNAMLRLLGEAGAQENPQLVRRIAQMRDALTLWYARAEVVQAMSKTQGEAKAVAAVQGLLPAFKGLIPQSILDSCRPRRGGNGL